MQSLQKENHVCVYCGRPAIHQFKNGKWCCAKNMNGCPVIKEQRINAAKKQWNEIKQQGYTSKEQFAKNNINLTKDLGTEGIEGICFYCGSPAPYQLKNGRYCCCKFSCSCPAIRKKNSDAIKEAYANGTLDAKLNYQNKSEQSKERMKWNKGLTKETNDIVRKGGQLLHQKYQSGKLIHSWLGRKHTKDQIDKIVKGMVHKRKGEKGFRCGWYKGYWCDSSWELAFVIYNLQHNIKFERNLNGFQYNYQNKKALFYPDFIMQDGTYIEIKGWYSQSAKAKIQQFPKQLSFKLLLKKDMQKYFDYVKEKYGQNFISLYQVNK